MKPLAHIPEPFQHILTRRERRALAGEVFRNTDLRRTDLSFADLRWARFENCDLVGCNLACADLRGASFLRCDLRNAWFTLAKLSNTRFDRSIATGARMSPDQRDYVLRQGGVIAPLGR